MDFGFLIIIFVIIMVIVSAVSKRKKPAKKEEGESEPVPRPTTMSDIQRAFMMMTDSNNEEKQEPFKVERPAPKPASPFRNYSNEGIRGATEGFMSDQGTRSDGAKSSFEGIRKDGIAISKEGFRDHSISTASTEGTRYKTMAAMEARIKEDSSAPMQHRLQNRIEDLGDQEKVLFDSIQAKSSNIKLFQNQNDIVKAIIYSEILKRKSNRKV